MNKEPERITLMTQILEDAKLGIAAGHWISSEPRGYNESDISVLDRIMEEYKAAKYMGIPVEPLKR